MKDEAFYKKRFVEDFDSTQSSILSIKFWAAFEFAQSAIPNILKSLSPSNQNS